MINQHIHLHPVIQRRYPVQIHIHKEAQHTFRTLSSAEGLDYKNPSGLYAPHSRKGLAKHLEPANTIM